MVSDVPFTKATLTTETMAVVEAEWPVLDFDTVDVRRLYGGEESAAFRLGDVVVRIGPDWRTIEEAEWCHGLVSAVHRRIPSALAPLPNRDGRTTVRAGGRPVSVWPFVEGRWGDREDPHQATEAATVLARIHRALADCHPASPPPRSPPQAPLASVDDPDLDRWLSEFARCHPRTHPLHGDFYPGNVLVRDGRIVAVLDWDEALISPPEMELAWAACEWGDVLRRADLARARRFMAVYGAAGGTAEALDDEALAQLYRQRLRSDLAYTEAAGLRCTEADEDDAEHHDRQLEVFGLLRP